MVNGAAMVLRKSKHGIGFIRAIAILSGLMAWPAQSAEPIPIFDTHVHYSESAWAEYGPADIEKLLDAAGVGKALVSSTPDDGTLRLSRHNPKRFIPVLRPYHQGFNASNWAAKGEIVAYLESRLAKGDYRGIGEFHLPMINAADRPQLLKVTNMAVRRKIPLHIHSDAGPIRELFMMNPEIRILWAHAGMLEGPDVVGEMLAAYPGLSTEVSFRSADISPDGTHIDPDWRTLLDKFPDRFMIGSDTYITTRWDEYPGLIAEHRSWLKALPEKSQRMIGFENAERWFGGGN